MSWLVEDKIIQEAITGTAIINEEDVEKRPEKVPASILDENVCLISCRKYFTHDAWDIVEEVMRCVQKNPLYYCGCITNPINDETENSIYCDSCLLWYHFKCITTVTKHWFCLSCYSETSHFFGDFTKTLL